MKNTKARLLAAVFAEAKKMGIDAEFLRDGVAPAVIRKRLSEASPRELCRLLDHVTGLYYHPPLNPLPSREGKFKYDSSRGGLIEELKAEARARWGEDFEKPLNAFINANRPAKTHYRFMNVAALKAIKERIRELNKRDANDLGQRDYDK